MEPLVHIAPIAPSRHVSQCDVALQAPTAGLPRRDFLKAAGAAGAGGALTGCRTTGHIFPYVAADGRFIPGVAEHFATVCRECPAGCGMHIRVNDGRATKPEGNPEHPINRGKLCMRGQSSVQGLYSPDRFQQPMLRDAHGQLRPISWQQALARLRQELGAVEAAGQQSAVAWLGRLETGSLAQLTRDWLAAFGFPPPLHYEPFAYEALREANRLSFGRDIVPLYRFDRARFLLALGADFLETWVSNVQFAVDFTASHSYGHTQMPARFVHAAAHLNMTAANADEYWQPRPGNEALLALGLAERVSRLLDQALSLPAGMPATAGLDPAQLAAATDVPADVLDRAAARLIEHRPSLVLGPGYAATGSAALAAHIAVNAINQMLGNIGQTVLLDYPHALSQTARAAEVAALLRRAQARHVRLLFLHHANPAFNFPGAFNVEAGLARIPFIVSFGWWRDESTQYAHLVLPDHYPLESWGDYAPFAGVTGILQPAMRPVFDTRPTADILLWLAAQEGGVRQATTLAAVGGARVAAPVAPAAAAMAEPVDGNLRDSQLLGAMLGAPDASTFAPPAQIATFDAYLRRTWQMRLAPGGDAATQEQVWRNLLMHGVHVEPAAQAALVGEPVPGALGPPVGGVLPTENQPGVNGDPPPLDWQGVFEGDGEFYLVTYPTVQWFDGRQANRGWCQEIADPITKSCWDNWVWVHPETAAKLKIAAGYLLRLDSPYGHAEFPVHVITSVRRDTLAIPLGQGHRDFGMFANLGAQAPQRLWTPRLDAAGGFLPLGIKVHARYIGKQRPLAALQLEHWQGDKKIALATTVASANTPAAREQEVRATFYGFHPHPIHRWGMAVDLSSCIGCNACQAACYAENNIPVMGRVNCLSHREMTWLRIETFAGDAWHPPTLDNPDVRFIPIPCQQCGNAPCEYVCPVFAAYHTDEGLNAQIYNRCVGTRYCSNNCIYKVRRFNWFTPQWSAPLDQQLNPAVTVRAKGVMEKCTYCVQRIEAAELRAKAERRALRDGEIQTACMQTCPTEAIVFGDLKDPESRVSKLSTLDRAYRMFYEQNTFPSVSYLKKTRFELNSL